MVLPNNKLIPIQGTWAIRTLRAVEVTAPWRVTLPAGLVLLAEVDGVLVTVWSDYIPLGRATLSLRAGHDYEVVHAQSR